MKRIFNFIYNYKYIFISGILGFLAFVCIYGVNVIDPTYVDWILNIGNDLGQHYFGWEFYRNSPWTFPIGMNTIAVYPNSVSVIFTDSIPFLAVIFKLFSPLLPSSFQYLGLYGVLCFILQGVTASIILKKFVKNDYLICLLSIFFILSPTMIHRMFYHTALASHYLILLAIILLIYKDKFSVTKNIVYWGLLGLVCSSIHIYILLIDGIILLGYMLYELLTTKNYKKALLTLLSYLLFAGFTVFILGGFSANLSTAYSEFGTFNYNLLGLFESFGYSKIIQKSFILISNQMEGFAYLGFGLILGLCFSIICLIYLLFKKKLKGLNKKLLLSLLIICVISLILSCLKDVYFGNTLLFSLDLEIISKLLVSFRSNGRIIWILYYILIIVIIYILYKTFDRRFIWVIFIVLLSIQIYDLSDAFKNMNLFYDNRYEFKISDDLKKLFKEDFDHVVLLTNFDYNYDKMYEIDKLVIENNKTVNRFYLAQNLMDIEIEKQIPYYLSNIDDRSIYIIPEESLFKYDQLNLKYYLLDDIYVLTNLDLDYEEDIYHNRIELYASTFTNVKLNENNDYLVILDGYSYDKINDVQLLGNSFENDISVCYDTEVCDLTSLTYYVKYTSELYINISTIDELNNIIIQKID